ncbi:MAG: UDP-N-acetylmuramate--L-alanine ligase [Myxococcota bacterium]|nr:UDP-N-acetylmuramate--L-alanine ligase [Myxococcota bacterium]
MNALSHVHFIAVGGTGMGSLAGLLRARGVEVTGSDRALYPPMSTALKTWGIEAIEGFRSENVLANPPDLVVIGNAVRDDNPEALAAIEAGLPYKSFPDALYELAIAPKHCLTVSGTHGKTTTTSLCAYLLHATGRDPSFLVGGISRDFGGSFKEGKGQHFVVEGDEYDTAFFDKTPKFLHYHPETLIITSVEFDHADIYQDLAAVKAAFRRLVDSMPSQGTIVAAWDHPQVREVVDGAPCRVIRYGLEETRATDVDFLAREIGAGDAGTDFVLSGPEPGDREVSSPLYGRFNVENVLASLAAVAALGIPLGESTAELMGFQGVKRRQEVRGCRRGVTVIDDFAHHPTAVRGSIEALRSRYPGGRLLAVFEPRTNTSRRKLFQEDYAAALKGADAVVLLEVPDEPIYSATGEVTERLSATELVDSIGGHGADARSFASVEDIVAHLAETTRAGDAVLIMSNGAFGDIWGKLLSALDNPVPVG